MENVIKFDNFKNLKKGESLIKEDVTLMDDKFNVRMSVEVPLSLVNAFMKKVKDESGEKLEDRFGKTEIAEMLVKYINNSFLSIENLPTSIVLGTTYSAVQPVQTQGQTQPVQEEPQAQTQVQETPQNPQAQTTVTDVPATEVQTPQGQAQKVQTQVTQQPTQTI